MGHARDRTAPGRARGPERPCGRARSAPLHGIRSKTRAYRLFYGLAGPLLTVLRHFAPQWILTTDSLGRAMIAIGRHGAGKAVLESGDLYAIG